MFWILTLVTFAVAYPNEPSSFSRMTLKKIPLTLEMLNDYSDKYAKDQQDRFDVYEISGGSSDKGHNVPLTDFLNAQ